MELLWKIVSAVILALVEGITEFLPVSSTGHMNLVREMLGLHVPPSYEIFIQFGAILSICVIYSKQLLQVAGAVTHNENARRFAIGLFVAFLPAAAAGVAFGDFITHYLLESAFSKYVVAVSLVVGGVAIILIERMVKIPQYYVVEDFPLSLYLKIGLCQCLALVPGVSRSGATIMGALLMKVERSAAAEFSFFLAIPTMLGASAYSLYKSWHQLHIDDLFILALGFVLSYLSAYWVAQRFISFISSRGFGIFGWYRIVLGSFVLGYFLLKDIAAMMA